MLSLTRESAIAQALSGGAQAAFASADARAAAANLRAARGLANPLLTTGYSKAVPQYHASIELPLDFLTVRPARVSAALSTSEAAQYRLMFARSAVRFSVETLYTRAAATAAHAALSYRNAIAAESLLTIARVRRDAGDASELDVELARVGAGEALNAYATDSITSISTLLDLGVSIGVADTTAQLVLADSLLTLPADSAALRGARGSATAAPLSVVAAERELRAAEQTISLERRNTWSGFAITAGVEGHDPTGTERGVLPTVGVVIPLPVLNGRRGEVAVAEAERDRARAALALARRESAVLIGQTRRGLAAAANRVARDRDLVASANRVSQLSLTAYREGAAPLTSVLEAQRSARDALARLIDDLAATLDAAAALQLYTTTVAP